MLDYKNMGLHYKVVYNSVFLIHPTLIMLNPRGPIR